MLLNYVRNNCMEVSPCICIMKCSAFSGLAQRMICGMSRNFNFTIIILQFLYSFLQYKMEHRIVCSLSGCYSNHTKKELKFFSFPRDPAGHVCFHSWCNGFIICCLNMSFCYNCDNLIPMVMITLIQFHLLLLSSGYEMEAESSPKR
jgi:hypothetical protein